MAKRSKRKVKQRSKSHQTYVKRARKARKKTKRRVGFTKRAKSK